MMRITRALLILFTLHSSASIQAQQTVEYAAQYIASANGIAASARRELVKIGDLAYRLTDSLRAELGGQTIANLEQSSEFVLSAGGIVPRSFSYLLSGISTASQTIAYNWDAGIALSTEDDESWSIMLSDSVMDQLSHQFALRQQVRLGTESEFEFKIIDQDEVETYKYRTLGDEILVTPLGNLNTVKLERVREVPDSRATTIWLAKDWDFLLARIEQVNRSGLRIELELESAVVDNQEVVALP